MELIDYLEDQLVVSLLDWAHKTLLPGGGRTWQLRRRQSGSRLSRSHNGVGVEPPNAGSAEGTVRPLGLQICAGRGDQGRNGRATASGRTEGLTHGLR